MDLDSSSVSYLIIAKMGERARPSKRFSSRVLVTNVLRTVKKYHNNGGKARRVKGSTVNVVAIAPNTMKAMTQKSNKVVGNRSSLLPTSAENRFKMRPSGLVSKNSIFDLMTL